MDEGFDSDLDVSNWVGESLWLEAGVFRPVKGDARGDDALWFDSQRPIGVVADVALLVDIGVLTRLLIELEEWRSSGDLDLSRGFRSYGLKLDFTDKSLAMELLLWEDDSGDAFSCSVDVDLGLVVFSDEMSFVFGESAPI